MQGRNHYLIPINPYFLRMTAAVLLLLLAVACVTPVTAADTSGDDAKNYLIIYIIGSNLEAEYGEMSGLMQDMTANWDPNAGEMLIIYGGADKSGWDSGITITNASLLFSDLAKGSGNVTEDGEVLERLAADISTPEGMQQALSFAAAYQQDSGLTDAHTYLFFLDHGGGATGYGMNTVTGRMLSLPDIKTGLSDRTYDMIVMHACLMGTVESLAVLDDHADYLIAAEQIVTQDAVNYTELGRVLSADPSISPKELGEHIIRTAAADEVSTYALLDAGNVPDVVDALNAFGAALNASMISSNTVPVISDTYHKTQMFGEVGDSSDATSFDLWQFAEFVYANTEEGDLHTAAGNLMTAIDDAVIIATDDGQSSSARGVSVSSFTYLYYSTFPGNEVLSEAMSLDYGGWQQFYTNYVTTVAAAAAADAEPTTGDAETEEDESEEDDGSGITETVAGYLYTVNGTDVVIGERPLEKIYTESDDGIWKMVPTGKYYPCDWDGNWFVLNNGGEDVLVSMKYAGTGYEDGELREHYSIAGNLTRMVNGTEVTHPSTIIVTIDPAAGTVLLMKVFAVLQDEETGLVSLQLWDTTDLLAGDLFVPDLLIYSEAEDTITTTSGTPFIFGENPLENLWYQAFPEDQLSWLVVESNLIDEDILVSAGGDVDVSATTAAPAPVAGVLAGCAAAAVLYILRRR